MSECVVLEIVHTSESVSFVRFSCAHVYLSSSGTLQELDYTLDQLKKLKADRSELARWRKKLDDMRAVDHSATQES